MNIADKIRNQFPEFIESEYPTFIKFVEHYYEFLESAELILENTNGIYTTGEKIVGQTSGLEATIRAVDHPNSRIFISTQNKFIISEEIRQIPSINSQGDGRVDLEAVAVRILEITTNTAPNDALTTLLKSLQSGVYDFILEDGVSELLLENNDNISFEEYTSIAIYPDNILEFGSITVSNTSIIDQGTFIETNEIEDNGDIQTESIILTRISGYQRGDIDNDEDIDNSDDNELFRFIAGLIPESDPKHKWIVNNIITPMESDYTTYSEWIPNPPLGVSNIVSYRPNPIQTIEQLLDYRDIDSTVAIFFDRFREEFMSSIPNRLANGIDKRNIIKNITDLYREKGTSVGHQLFLKMLLNDDAELYYPSEDILEVSGGKWSYDQFVRVNKPSYMSDVSVIIGKEVLQKNNKTSSIINKATAIVESVNKFLYNSSEVLEIHLSIDSIKGKFIENELIHILGSDDINYMFTLSPIAVGATITNNGQNYSINDDINVTGFSTLPILKVSSLSSGRVDKIIVTSDGSGYEINENINFNETNSGGQGTEAYISGIHGSITMEDGTLNLATPTDPIIIQEDYTVWLSSRNKDKFLLESGNRELVDVDISKYGHGYTRPPILTIDSNTGSGGKILPITSNVGSVTSIDILDPGYNYSGSGSSIFDITLLVKNSNSNFIVGEIVTSNNNITGIVTSYDLDIHILKLKSTSGQFNASDTIIGAISNVSNTIISNNTATCNIEIGALYKSKGKYINEDGFISHNIKKIHDGYYYQKYSYLVKTPQSIINWRSALKSTVHPAGFNVFGEINISSNISSRMTVPENIDDSIKYAGLLNVSLSKPIFQNSSISITTIPENWLHGRIEYISPTLYQVTPLKEYIVHLNGVIQYLSNYTVNGSTLTFNNTIPDGTIVSIFEMSGGSITDKTFNNPNLPMNGLSQNHGLVYINNVIQIDNYSISAGVLTFDSTTTLSSTDTVYVIEFPETLLQRHTNYTTDVYLYDTFADYSVTNNVILYINGVYQVPNINYTVQ